MGIDLIAESHMAEKKLSKIDGLKIQKANSNSRKFENVGIFSFFFFSRLVRNVMEIKRPPIGLVDQWAHVNESPLGPSAAFFGLMAEIGH